MKPVRLLIFNLVIIYLAAACTPAEMNPTSPPHAPLTAHPDRTPTAAATSTITSVRTQAAPFPTPVVQATSTPPSPVPKSISVCSPLQNAATNQLADLVSNPFSPPPLGSDNPHQGIDFADLSGTERIAVAGRQVNVVLPGTVVTVIKDRFPYGNAVIVETMIDELPEGLAARLPTPAPTPERRAALTCPDVSIPYRDADQRSLYLLYAHMQGPPALQPGDSLTCGQAIGNIGSSGNALNPHLHLEARIGPSGVRLPGMAHYETRATNEEMSAYCLWRISGTFQPFDPLLLFSLTDH